MGLINNCVVSVHYSKWNEEKNLRAAVSKLGVTKGYGIDDDEGLYFENETLVDSEGSNYDVIQE